MPLPHDRHPSAKLYDHTLHCFVCNQSWDAVSLVAGLGNLTMLDAAKQLAGEYGIAPDTPEQRRKSMSIMDARRQLEAFKAQRKALYKDVLNAANECLRGFTPATCDDPLFTEALRAKSAAQTEIEQMLLMNTEDWIDMYEQEVGTNDGRRSCGGAGIC